MTSRYGLAREFDQGTDVLYSDEKSLILSLLECAGLGSRVMEKDALKRVLFDVDDDTQKSHIA